MDLLFDSLGPSARPPEVASALSALAAEEEHERGAIFTRPEIAKAILDLVGYTSEKPLYKFRLLEPAFGGGDFILPAIDRLLTSYFAAGGTSSRALSDLANAICAVELHSQSVSKVREMMLSRITSMGVGVCDAEKIVNSWLICDDFLLCRISGLFDFVVGNPPYVRQERIPLPLLKEYRKRYETLYDRADLYVPFYERSLDLLGRDGELGFICANRWIKNRYGGPLRAKIVKDFYLKGYIDIGHVDAFHSEVMAYPVITMIKKAAGNTVGKTRVVSSICLEKEGFSAIITAFKESQTWPSSQSIDLRGGGENPWLFDDLHGLQFLRSIESRFPALEDAGCKVGIGVATGCDRVFIDNYERLPVENERKIPLVMAHDLIGDKIVWSGKGVLNPFEDSGGLAHLHEWPRFKDYIELHRDSIAARHVALRNPEGWYRTIDKITPSLAKKPKLLVPDIKGEAIFVLDEGRYYPHHNLYFITSELWDLKALRTVLRSSLSVMIVAAYCTRMSGGYLRFQAQYLRRLRLPHWHEVTTSQRQALLAVDAESDMDMVDAPVFSLFGLNAEEAAMVKQVAIESQVAVRKRGQRQ